jgi:choline dehydrogenase
MQRRNLTVLTGVTIDRLTFDGKRATGVEVIQDGRRRRVTARLETILAAGSIGSPSILQRSGVGAGDRLQSLGIPVLHELPGVGANLQDHLQLRMIFKTQGIRSLNLLAGSLWGKMLMGVQYAFNRSGPLSMAPSQLGAFAKSTPDEATANLEYHVQPLSLDKFGDPLHDFAAFTASVCNLRPTSRGEVHIADRDPASAPGIAPRYLSTDADLAIAAASLKLTRRIVGMPALAPYHPEEFLPGPRYQTDAELAAAAGHIGTTIFHPVGTCRMGKPDERGSVVDSQLRVLGIDGLRVIDASIMPTITSGNTNAPTVMIAEKGSDLVRAARLQKTIS